MLVLTRKLGESIVILDTDGDVLAEVMVVKIQGRQAKLGISSDDLIVTRKEIYLREDFKGNYAFKDKLAPLTLS